MKIRFLILASVFMISGCAANIDTGADMKNSPKPKKEYVFINSDGETIETRINAPQEYKRVSAEENSLAEFLRAYPLKEDKSPVLLYDGSEKGNQNAHAAVLKLPIEPENLQQCADSVIRIYAEYFYKNGEYDRIAFHFTNGFLAEYSKWRQGYRIRVSGNDVSYVKTNPEDSSYECFKAYLKTVFAYAGTLSLESESEPADMSDLRVGDVFIKGGSPGHVVMVLDICENERGEKTFLLGQGYMPAQEFHVLKNPKHEKDPWYYESETKYPLKTPEYTFDEGSLRHLKY